MFSLDVAHWFLLGHLKGRLWKRLLEATKKRKCQIKIWNKRGQNIKYNYLGIQKTRINLLASVEMLWLILLLIVFNPNFEGCSLENTFIVVSISYQKLKNFIMLPNQLCTCWIFIFSIVNKNYISMYYKSSILLLYCGN